MNSEREFYLLIKRNDMTIFAGLEFFFSSLDKTRLPAIFHPDTYSNLGMITTCKNGQN